MKTSFGAKWHLRKNIQARICLCPHKLRSGARSVPWLISQDCLCFCHRRRPNSGRDTPVWRITWESWGVKARAELLLSVPTFFFFSFRLQPCEGVAVLSTAAANKIRLWGGPRPSGSLCVFGKHLVLVEGEVEEEKQYCQNRTSETSIVWEE